MVRWLKSIGNAIRLIVAYFLLVLATMLVIYFVAEFSSTVAVWALTSLFAAEAVAVGVFVGLAVLHGIGSVQRIIERMLPSQLYKIFRAGHFLRLTPHLILLIGFTILESFFIVIPISSRGSGNFGALAAETERVELDRDRLLLGVRAVLEDPAKGFYTVAETETTVVGQMMITFEWSDWRNGTFWWIQSVYVHPEYRRRGIFSRLYRNVLDEARNSGTVCGLRLYVEKENKQAQRTYQRLGMQKAIFDMYEVDFVLRR